MVRRHITVLGASIALLGPAFCADLSMAQGSWPRSEEIDIWAGALDGSQNRLSHCHVTGNVVLWVSRSVELIDDMDMSVGVVDAGLAQFGHGSKLEGCVPDARALDLSDRFANFLIADNRPLRSGPFNRQKATAFASLLAQVFYRLVELDGKQKIPLVDGIEISATGSVTYRFEIVLIRDANSSSMDAVIHRETIGTKFAPRLAEEDRRLSRLKWSSIP